ncbi:MULTISPECIES: hypothetical protein [Aquimarina]|uniref:hypothetical protein n=1 Tax=Aquimarina TaxID=290174 RepID=UPI0003FDA754|nr:MULTISPECIES: hypothetical protein [Aquimarina]
MSRRLFDFNIKEWEGSFPEEGNSRFIFSAAIDREGSSGSGKNMKREFTVFCEPNDDNGFSRTVKIKTISSEIKLNSGSSAVNELLNQLSSLYNTCTLQVKYDGTVIGVTNYLQIQSDWKKIKQHIEQDYKGSHIRMFTRSIDSRLETEQKIISDISSFENFGLLFHSIYGKYDSLSPVVKEFRHMGMKKVYPIRESIKVSALNDTNVVLSIEIDTQSSEHIAYSGSYQINSTNQWIEKASVETKDSYDGVEIRNEFHLQQKV